MIFLFADSVLPNLHLANEINLRRTSKLIYLKHTKALCNEDAVTTEGVIKPMSAQDWDADMRKQEIICSSAAISEDGLARFGA